MLKMCSLSLAILTGFSFRLKLNTSSLQTHRNLASDEAMLNVTQLIKENTRSIQTLPLKTFCRTLHLYDNTLHKKCFDLETNYKGFVTVRLIRAVMLGTTTSAVLFEREFQKLSLKLGGK